MYSSPDFSSCRAARFHALWLSVVVGVGMSGCTAVTGIDDGVYKETIPVDAMTLPLDMDVVCVFNNEENAAAGIQLAMEEGIRRFGSRAKFIPPVAGPQACSMVVAYEIRGQDGQMFSIHFQTYENSIPKIQAHGRSPQSRPLNFDAIANYTLQLMRKTKERRTKGILRGDMTF